MPNPETKTIPVAIAGGGPVGLMLALFLDRYGVRSVIFNSEPQVRRHPKGSTHNARTMEHHRRIGIGPQVRDLCLPINRPTDVSYYTSLTGWELGRIPMPSEADRPGTRAAAARQPDVRRGVPACARPHAPEHHDPLRLAGRQIR
jgi:2-polyprenyl-6-methoxyphenol hydroxylase-like FAD-dependent oxidoreductase